MVMFWVKNENHAAVYYPLGSITIYDYETVELYASKYGTPITSTMERNVHRPR